MKNRQNQRNQTADDLTLPQPTAFRPRPREAMRNCHPDGGKTMTVLEEWPLYKAAHVCGYDSPCSDGVRALQKRIKRWNKQHPRNIIRGSRGRVVVVDLAKLGHIVSP